MHVDLQQSGLRQFLYEFLIFMEGDGDVLDGLLDTVVGDVGLTEVVVGNDQSEIWFAIVEHQKFIEGQLLYFYVDQVLAWFLPGCLV